MKTCTNAVETTIIINNICSTIKNLDNKEVRRLFVENKIPYYNSLVTYLIKKGYLKRNNNLYTWVKQEPLYYKEIESCLDNIRKEKKLNRIEDITEDDAIAFLKSKGYKIMKPIVEYTEI